MAAPAIKVLMACASSGAFSPDDVSGLNGWWDASDTATITLSGSEVTQWDDKSGNGFHMTRIDANTGPNSGTRTRNGLNVLDFNGAGKRLGNAAAAVIQTSVTLSIFVVFVQDTTPGSPFLSNVAWVNTPNEMLVRTSSTASQMVATGGGATTVTASAYTNGNWRQVCGVHLNAAGGLELHENGTLIGTTTAASDVLGDQLRLGSSNAGTRSLDGAIAEVILYQPALNATDRDAVEAYLATKWGSFP